jgi:hypothetical protein
VAFDVAVSAVNSASSELLAGNWTFSYVQGIIVTSRSRSCTLQRRRSRLPCAKVAYEAGVECPCSMLFFRWAAGVRWNASAFLNKFTAACFTFFSPTIFKLLHRYNSHIGSSETPTSLFKTQEPEPQVLEPVEILLDQEREEKVAFEERGEGGEEEDLDVKDEVEKNSMEERGPDISDEKLERANETHAAHLEAPPCS